MTVREDPDDPDISVSEMLDEVARGGASYTNQPNGPSFPATIHPSVAPPSANSWRHGKPRPFPWRVVAGRLRPLLGKRAKVLIIVGVAVVCGLCTDVGRSALRPTSTADPAPAPVATVTVTVTVTATKTVTESLPQSCVQAIGDAQKLLQAASSIASSQSEVLDIIDHAYQAIMLGDVVKLNAAASEARAFDLAVTKLGEPILWDFKAIMDGFATCPSK